MPFVNYPRILPRLRGVAAISAALAVLPTAAQACAEATFLGAVCFTAAPACPNGYVPADGTSYSIYSYTALFTVLGTTFGGDGTKVFSVPNLSGRSPVGVGTDAMLPANQVSFAQIRGSETHTLSVAEMPVHTHTTTLQGNITPPQSVAGVMTASTAAGSASLPSNTTPYLAAVSEGNGMYGQLIGTPGEMLGVSMKFVSQPVTDAVKLSPTGKGEPFNLRPPSFGLTACISYEGVFPNTATH